MVFNNLINYNKLVKGQQYVFQRKRISQYLPEKTFEAFFEELIVMNDDTRILLSGYVDKDTNSAKSRVSMPVSFIEYIIRPTFNLGTLHVNSKDSNDTTSFISDDDYNSEQIQNENDKGNKGNEYDYINESYEYETNSEEPPENIYEYHNNSDNKENIPLTEEQRLLNFFYEN